MNEFEQMLEDVRNQYNRVIIINDKDSEKYRETLKKKGIEIVNLSAKLSELLSNLSDEERQMEAWDILKGYIDGLPSDIIAFDTIDYMFSPEVGGHDPVVNFNYYSRKGKIIILFIHAKKRGNILFYSEKGARDFREMDVEPNIGFLIGW